MKTNQAHRKGGKSKAIPQGQSKSRKPSGKLVHTFRDSGSTVYQVGPDLFHLHGVDGYSELSMSELYQLCLQDMPPILRQNIVPLALEPVMNFWEEKSVQCKYNPGISLEWRRNAKDIRVM